MASKNVPTLDDLIAKLRLEMERCHVRASELEHEAAKTRTAAAAFERAHDYAENLKLDMEQWITENTDGEKTS